jgi:hypothetical protein
MQPLLLSSPVRVKLCGVPEIGPYQLEEYYKACKSILADSMSLMHESIGTSYYVLRNLERIRRGDENK